MTPEMLTPQEVADRLRVSRSVVYAMCRAGTLPHVRVGTGRGSLRIPSDSLESYLRGQLRRSTAARAQAVTRWPLEAGNFDLS